MPHAREQTQLVLKQLVEGQARVASPQRDREPLGARALTALEAFAVVELQGRRQLRRQRERR